MGRMPVANQVPGVRYFLFYHRYSVICTDRVKYEILLFYFQLKAKFLLEPVCHFTPCNVVNYYVILAL